MQANQCKVDYRSLDITDSLFSHYVDMIADRVIPYQWEILNDRVEGATRSHCLQNFKIAAKQSQGSFYGQVFQDSDVYKWLEALSYCLQRGKALQFVPIADQVVDLIEAAQQPDGYLHTYHIINGLGNRWTNLVEAHELYCAGYLIEAAIAYHEATGKDRLLQVAIRFADLICATFGRVKTKCMAIRDMRRSSWHLSGSIVIPKSNAILTAPGIFWTPAGRSRITLLPR
jgi:DUF1680 family protein